jgi:amidophosphoribosyltransferase
LHDTYNGIKALQHRGQDTAGIAAKYDGGIDVLRWAGMVETFSLDSAHMLLGGDMFIGHVRYATSYKEENKDLFSGAHPRHSGGIVTEHKNLPYPHTIARGASHAIVHNGNVPGLRCGPDEIDTDVMQRAYIKYGLEWLMQKMPAAYSCAIMDAGSNEVVVFRDRKGIRPLWVGEKDGRVIAASEDVAIWDVGGKPIREVRPGEAIFIRHNGRDFRSQQMVKPDGIMPCFFEFNYNAALSSSWGGKTITDVSYRLGAQLAMEWRPDADLVTYIPRRPKPMAMSYAEVRKIPFIEIFYKVGNKRAFLGPDDETRRLMIGGNLFLRDNAIPQIRGKRVIVIDDSIVRMINAPDAAGKARDIGGVEWLGLGACTPPLGPVSGGERHSCVFGVDMPPEDQFAIRKYKTHEELVKASGFDDVGYLSLDGMLRAHRVNGEQRCLYCIGGRNPLSEEEVENLRQLEV